MRTKTINKFNQDPDKYPYIRQFQEIMIAKLTRDLTSKELKTLINYKFKRPVGSIKVNPEKLIILTTEVEPEIYILVQETAKKVTGDYLPMEQLLHLLLTTFIKAYEKEPFKFLPFKHIRKGARFKTLRKFQDQFSQHYPNCIKFLEQD